MFRSVFVVRFQIHQPEREHRSRGGKVHVDHVTFQHVTVTHRSATTCASTTPGSTIHHDIIFRLIFTFFESSHDWVVIDVLIVDAFAAARATVGVISRRFAKRRTIRTSIVTRKSFRVCRTSNSVSSQTLLNL